MVLGSMISNYRKIRFRAFYSEFKGEIDGEAWDETVNY